MSCILCEYLRHMCAENVMRCRCWKTHAMGVTELNMRFHVGANDMVAFRKLTLNHLQAVIMFVFGAYAPNNNHPLCAQSGPHRWVVRKTNDIMPIVRPFCCVISRRDGWRDTLSVDPRVLWLVPSTTIYPPVKSQSWLVLQNNTTITCTKLIIIWFDLDFNWVIA